MIFEKQYAFKPKNKIKPFQKIVLEDIEFEKRFDTYSTNQVEARYLLTTLFMKRFENLKTPFIDMANEICSVLAISKQLNLDSKTGL